MSFADAFIQQAMQQNEQARDPNAGSGFVQGAQLAQHAEELKLQHQQLQQKQQELQMAKLEKVGNWFENASKMEDGATKKAFINSYIPNGINALGLTDVFHPDTLKMAQAEPVSMLYMKTKVQQDPSYLTNVLLPAAADPEKFAQLVASPEFAQFKGQQMTQAALQESVSALKKDFDKGNENAAKMNRAQVAAQVQSGRQQATFAHEDVKDEQTFRTKIADKIGSDLHPLVADKAHLNSALEAGNRIMAAYNSGKTPSHTDTTLLATGLATTISKRINPTEFDNLMHLPGAQNWSVDQWNKWLAGGTNMNVVKGLLAAAHDQDSQLNQEIGAVQSRLESEVSTSRYSGKADSILSPLRAELASMPKHGSIVLGGKTYSKEQVRAFVKKFANDPKQKDAVAAAKKALGE